MRIIIAALVVLLSGPALAEVALDGPNGTRFRIDDTGHGGLVGPGAFTDWPQLCVRVCAACDDPCAAGAIYSAGGQASGNEINGRQRVLATDALAGLDVRRKVFVPNAGGALADGFVRYLDSLTNNGRAAVTVAVRVGSVRSGTGRLGVAGLTVWRTATDDAELEPVDRWLVIDDANNVGGAAAVGALVHGAGAEAAGLPDRIGLRFPDANDGRNLAWDFREVTVNPGQTVSLLTVVVHEAARANAIDEVDNLLRMREADVLFGLTAAERRSIINFDVDPANGSPTADAGGPYNADEGQQIQLTAVDSFDNEGGLTYEWDLNNDGNYDDADNINAFHTIEDDGVYTIGLRVTDAGGKSDTATARITVRNVAPQVEGVITDAPIDEGSRLSLEVQVIEPGADQLTYDFDWDGDGEYDELGVEQAAWDHLYPDDGVFTATVRVSDGDGGQDTYDFAVRVDNVAPIIRNVVVPPGVAEGADVAIQVIANDPGDDEVTYFYDLNNDGEFDQQGVELSAIVAQFPDDGLFTVLIRACDEQDACSDREQVVNVGNVRPTIVEVVNDGPVDEGSPVQVVVTATDPGGPGDPLAYSIDWDNDGEFDDDVLDSPLNTQQHVFLDEGQYFVGVRVRDDDNGIAVGNTQIQVNNVAPSAQIAGPGGGLEGQPIPFSCAGSDPGNDPLVYDWDLDGDGQFEVLGGANEQSPVFPQEAVYTIQCRVSDGDGGVDIATADIVISNDIPTLEIDAASPQNEGAEVVVRAIAEEQGDDELSYTFDFDDDGMPEIADVSGPGADIGRHIYPDQGLYTVRVTVDDGTDAISATVIMDIRNVAPTVLLSSNSPVDEGGQLTLTAEVSDPGDDTITLRWDIDGDELADVESPAEGPVVEQLVLPADDSRFTATVWAVDEDGGESSATTAVLVRNVPPSFPDEFFLPPALEGDAYRGTVPADDPAGFADPLSFSLVNPPGHIDININTGQILWTPTYDDVLNSPVQVTARIDDGDGGSAETDLLIEVLARDDDNDQIPDSFEALSCDPNNPEICLDPADPSDAREDPDGDGRDNLTEWLEGTDPFFFEGPETPQALAPADGGRLDRPDQLALVVSWVDSPVEGEVAIVFEVYADAELANLIIESEPQPQAEDEEPTGWVPPDGLLFEDQTYWWRARATAGDAISEWSVPFSFRVNFLNEPPGQPMLLEPANEAVVDNQTPTFRATTTTDIDGDELRYIFNIFDARTQSGVGTVVDGAVQFTSPSALTENALIEWEVVAVDSAGAMTASERWILRIDSENAAPSAPVFIDPDPESVPRGGAALVETVSPTFIAGESIDEDGEPIEYMFGLRTVGGEMVAESGPVTPDENGEAAWALDAPLSENGDYVISVYTVDSRGTVSETTDITIFVSAVDEPPPAPTPQSPADGSTVAVEEAILVWSAVEDPEREEPVTYTIEYCDAEGVCTTATREGLSLSLVDIATPGETYTWTITATDPQGKTGPTSPAQIFAIQRDATSVTGCGCEAADDHGPTPWTLVLLALGLVGLRRRR